ncbi:hypothetical protein HBN50_06000 [Halobacteriovorax sp. GB3]|uniref:hypothetical protein n=1 Tax=Halobacteriovorax sp. GB3 TaxID=2719615 RepID=UPI002362D93F|nr:hypothetical protein [Halobacteriovorax sp. GB3]MDD0852639.1 hypothetical protein [Halobacteriovorax sp. GB3]
MQDLIYFIVKYIPFWATPIMLMALSFAYVYWIKDIRSIAFYLVITSFLCFLINLYWLVTGGPSGSVRFIQEFVL